MVDVLTLLSTRLRRDEEHGATATEYAILVGFMVFAMILGLTLFGSAISSQFSTMSTVVAGFN